LSRQIVIRLGAHPMENEQNGFKKLTEVAGDSLEANSEGGNIAAGAQDLTG